MIKTYKIKNQITIREKLVLLLGFYAVSYEFLRQSKLGDIGYYTVYLFLVAFIILMWLYISKRFYPSAVGFAWLPLICVLIKYRNNTSSLYLFLWLAFVSVTFSYGIRATIYQRVIHMFLCASIFYAIGVYLQVIFPGLVSELTRRVLSDSGYASNQRLYTVFGYYPGFTHQVSHTALYLLVGIMILAFAREQLRINKNRTLIIGLMLSVALLLQGKRAHLVFTVFAILLTYILKEKGHTPSRFIKVMIGTIGALVIIIIALPILRFVPAIDRTYETIVFALNGGNTNSILEDSGRLILYDSAIALFRSNPIWGIGWGKFVEMSGDFNTLGTSVHNVFLQLLCETGIVGLSCYILGAITSLSSFFKTRTKIAMIKDENRDNLQVLWCWSFAFQIFMLAYCFTGNPIYNEDYLMMYMFSILINVSIQHYRPEIIA